MRRYSVRIKNKEKEVLLERREGNCITFQVEGVSYEVQVDPVLNLTAQRGSAPLVLSPPIVQQHRSSSRPGDVCAPMPGIIVNVLVKEGAQVKIGENLVVIEAMKMENNIPSPTAGKVTKILVEKGKEVGNGELLLKIE